MKGQTWDEWWYDIFPIRLDCSHNKSYDFMRLYLIVRFWRYQFEFTIGYYQFSHLKRFFFWIKFFWVFIIVLALLESTSQVSRIALLSDSFANTRLLKSFSFLEVWVAISVDFFLALVSKTRKSKNELLFCIFKQSFSIYQTMPYHNIKNLIIEGKSYKSSPFLAKAAKQLSFIIWLFKSSSSLSTPYSSHIKVEVSFFHSFNLNIWYIIYSRSILLYFLVVVC